MLAKILSGAVVGLTPVPITVEVDISSHSLPSFTIVGLPDKAVEESKERVRAAIRNSGASFPDHRVTVNLAPADLPKVGPAYDLPIAVGILIASGQLAPLTKEALFLGELSLDGTLRHTNGVLPITMMLKGNKTTNRCYVPLVDAKEAAVTGGIVVYPVMSLIGLFHHLTGAEKIIPQAHTDISLSKAPSAFAFDFADVAGQEQVKRALEIAAAGAHNIFMQGPPGAGKTMLARCLPSILPTMTEDEALEVTKIYSITGNLPPGESLVTFRPFRSPHHTTSRVGLIGGGAKLTPGEISLAHRGVLFMDELPECPRHVLEALRQPIEDGVVTISRAVGSVQYPAKFMFVAAANPCPCGHYRSVTHECTCPPAAVLRYQKRISGPLMDRIDIHIHVPTVATEKLIGHADAEPSLAVRKRVQRARIRQWERLEKRGIHANAEMTTKQVKEYCPLSLEVHEFMRHAVSRFSLTARSYYRVIKVARTIADLDGEQNITLPHIAEALQYRAKDESI
jgi:magnesium chelatase family protein